MVKLKACQKGHIAYIGRDRDNVMIKVSFGINEFNYLIGLINIWINCQKGKW